MQEIKIAFMGIAGSGKDTLAQHLTNEHNFKRYAFGDEIKKIANYIYPWLELDYPAFVKEEPLNITLPCGTVVKDSPRDIYKFINKLREKEDGLFVRRLGESIQQEEYQGNIVITDVRFKIELEYVKKNGYVVVYVEPSELLYEPNDTDKEVHVLKEYADYTFVNDFSPDNNNKERLDLLVSELLNK